MLTLRREGIRNLIVKEILTSPKFIAISLAVIALIVIPLTLIQVQNMQTIEQHASVSCPSGYNGDSNSVIWCGAYSNGTAKASRITYAYQHGDGHNSASSIQHIYSYFKISSSDISNLSSNAKVGTVTKSGDVILNGKVVATNAVTAGRSYISGSTKHSYGGTTFYTRPPKVSFLNNSLSAYIVMDNGKFKFAILISCGNPVSGTAKYTPPPPTPTNTPTPTKKPTPTPTVPPGQPTPTICPTLSPVKNVHIVCPNCNAGQ